jgi:hypothetical protein
MHMQMHPVCIRFAQVQMQTACFARPRHTYQHKVRKNPYPVPGRAPSLEWVCRTGTAPPMRGQQWAILKSDFTSFTRAGALAGGIMADLLIAQRWLVHSEAHRRKVGGMPRTSSAPSRRC